MESTASRRTFGLICLALGLITFALYLPSVRFDFLSYDDQQYVTENPHVRAGLTFKGLGWTFGFNAGNWHPLTWLSHMLDCQIYGVHPAGHHLTNVLLHTASTVLLFILLTRLTGGASVLASRDFETLVTTAARKDARPTNPRQGLNLWPSAIVAALFAWHPLHVESVAWVAERKDVLCGLFWMLTLLAYVKYSNCESVGREKPETRNPKSEANRKLYYAVALLFFALGLMSKPMVVTLPFVLLLLDFWPLQRFQSFVAHTNAEDNRTIHSSSPCPLLSGEGTALRLVAEKLPFFALTIFACLLTIEAQSKAHAVASISGLPIGTRIAHALASYVHYLGAILWPRHLAVYYPYETATPAIPILGAALLLIVASAIAFYYARKLPFLLVGWLWFLGMLVPVIGLVQVGEQAWADRYTYLPSIGFFVVVVWGAIELIRMRGHGTLRTPRATNVDKVGRGWPAQLALLTAPGIATIAICISSLMLTSLQLRYWKNTRNLFEHTAAVTRNNYMAITLLGSLDAKEGRFNEAIERYKMALNWKPDYPEAHFFLGNALDQQGKLDAAIVEYQKALWYKPIQVQTHIFLGAALAKKKQNDEAIEHYLAALKLDPESAVAHNNLAKVLQVEGKSDQAMEHYSAALKFDPSLAQAHNNLGILLLGQRRVEEGIRELREALRLNPGDLETEFNLALALIQGHQWNEAAELLAKVLEKRGNAPKAHYELAVALIHLQRTREAMNHYASALLLNPDFPDALDGLSWILATAQDSALRNGPEAVRMAERACELTDHKEPQKLKTLAAAYAEGGRVKDAVSTIETAISISSGSANATLADGREMLEAFKASKPWRDPELK